MQHVYGEKEVEILEKMLNYFICYNTSDSGSLAYQVWLFSTYWLQAEGLCAVTSCMKLRTNPALLQVHPWIYVIKPQHLTKGLQATYQVLGFSISLYWLASSTRQGGYRLSLLLFAWLRLHQG